MCTHVQALIQITVCEFLNTCDIDWLMPQMILITVSVWESDVQSGGYTWALPNSYVRICVTMAYYYINMYMCVILGGNPSSFPPSSVFPHPPWCSRSLPGAPTPFPSPLGSLCFPQWQVVQSQHEDGGPCLFECPVCSSWKGSVLPTHPRHYTCEPYSCTHTLAHAYTYTHTHTRMYACTNAFMHAQWQWYRRGW